MCKKLYIRIVNKVNLHCLQALSGEPHPRSR
nr:MAG TPA: hypothetical protein [Caudoviricetes sp.]